MREEIGNALKDAIKARDARRTATLRAITAAIKDRDIAVRANGRGPIGDADILALIGKMMKQREESREIYAKAGRDDLARIEAEEIAILQEYLPRPLGEDELDAAIRAAIEKTGADGPGDMGKVISELKAEFPGRIDFASASGRVKAALTDV